MAKDRKIPITVHLSPEIVALTEADRFGDSFSQVVLDRLAQAFKMGPRQQSEASPLESIELRRKEADAAMAEQRAAILRGEFVKKAVALDVIQREFAIINSRVKQIPFQIPDLTPEQTHDANRAVQDAFTDLTCDKHAIWDDLAKQTADDL